jgi:hypothetical protein
MVFEARRPRGGVANGNPGQMPVSEIIWRFRQNCSQAGGSVSKADNPKGLLFADCERA